LTATGHHITRTIIPLNFKLHSAHSLLGLLFLLRTLRLRRSSRLLVPILPLLPLLSTGLLDLGGMSHSDQPVVGFEFLHRLDGVVDEREARGFAAAVLGAHAENVDLVFVGLVGFGEFCAQVVFADVRAVGVQDIDNELLAREEAVGDELASADRDR